MKKSKSFLDGDKYREVIEEFYGWKGKEVFFRREDRSKFF